ncbi:darcynin family protein [Teredinibacter purpureus]|uniref:darcynin family protein n=1 Tax=Teredinibacter purpureus TaxID=2731756 RepID=UPI0005F7D542|nr:darcynin family protein [Teredinibacter purpureus]
MKFAIILKYSFTNKWFNLTRPERQDFELTHIFPLIQKYAEELTVRTFDSEAFESKFSDFAIVETQNLKAHTHFMDDLRDSPLIAHGYATFNDIFMGIEDGYKEYNQETK